MVQAAGGGHIVEDEDEGLPVQPSAGKKQKGWELIILVSSCSVAVVECAR